MNESKYISQKISKLVCQLKVDGKHVGTGILYKSKNNKDTTFLLTAKHNLLSEANELISDINNYTICFNNKEGESREYILSGKNRFICNKEDDIVIVALPTFDVESIVHHIPSIDIISDSGDIRSAFFYGYPIGFEMSSPKRVDVTINPPFNNSKIDLSSNLDSETNLVENTVPGLSGSGIALACNNDVFLFGIVTKFKEWKRFEGLSLNVINAMLSDSGYNTEDIITIETDEKKIAASQKLKQNSASTLRIIESNIADIHIDRTDTVSKIVETVMLNKLTVVHGVAGAGKSSCCKEALLDIEQNHGYNTISIKGEQICRDGILEFFSDIKIDIPLEDILQSKEYLGNTLIYIDAAEKTIENSKPDIIKEIIELSNKLDNIKVILSIRSYALTQTTFGLYYNLPSNMGQVEVELLNSKELQHVIQNYPSVSELAKNPKVSDFIRTPFYLKNVVLVLGNIKGQEKSISEGELKKLLWANIVRKEYSQRERILQELALKRSKELLPYVSYDIPSDSEVYFKQLISDNIIVENEDSIGVKTYAPAHDIFEDWALVRQIQILYRDSSASEKFILKLDKSYGYQRGFKFWLSEMFEKDDKEAVRICNNVLFDPDADIKWKDQIIISILNSKSTYAYFNSNKEKLQADDFTLLKRFVFFLRVTCKSPEKDENTAPSFYDDREYSYSEKLLPKGQAWVDIIKFLWENYDKAQKLDLLIIQVLLEWRNGVKNYSHYEYRDAALLIMSILENLKFQYGNYNHRHIITFIDELIYLLFRLSSSAQSEILKLINSAESFLYDFENNKEQKTSEEYHLRDFHSKIINTCLFWEHTEEIAKCHPSKIIELAKKNWLKVYPKDYQRRGGETAQYFGISDSHRRDYFPASAHQTPIINLLNSHHESTLTFLVEFINKATENYTKSPFAKDDDLTSVEITLNDGTVRSQYGSEYLWSIYRGSGKVSPYLLQSVLMALEKWLLEIARNNDQAKIKYVYDYLLLNSHSVCTTSVLASAAIAYPFAIGKHMMPLFSSLDIIRWDLHRFAGERGHSSFGFPLEGKEHADAERKEADNLKHRRSMLEHLAFSMSFYEGYSDEILTLIDKHTTTIAQNSKTDKVKDYSIERLILNRMDKRAYKVTKQTEEGIVLEAEIKDELKPIVEDAAEFGKQTTEQLVIGQWARKIYDDGDMSLNTLEKWQENYSSIVSDTKTDLGIVRSYGYNAGVAAIGLKYYFDELNDGQFAWCKSTILAVAPQFASIRSLYDGAGEHSPLNKAAALQSLPILLNAKLEKKEHEEITRLIIQALFELDMSDGTSKPVFYDMAKSLWVADEELALQCLCGFIKLGNHDFKHNDNIVNVVKEQVFNRTLIYHNDIELLYDYSNEYYLDKAFLLISEVADLGKENLAFAHRYVNYIITGTYKNKIKNVDDGYDRREYYYNVSNFKQKFGYLLLNQNSDIQTALFNEFLNHFYKPIGENVDYLSQETLELGRDTLEYIVYTVDRTKQDDSLITLWRIFLKRIIESKRALFISILLLDIKWKDSANDWQPLANNKDFFNAILVVLGGDAIESSIKLVSGIGSKSMLPEAIIMIEKIITTEGLYKDATVSYNFEKLIQKCFYIHGKEIKGNDELRNSFLNVLEFGVERGSAIAFIIRENMLSLS